MEIVPLKKRLENNNQQGVCIVEYEDTAFRFCCPCKDQVDSYYTGKDTMDRIWRRQESMLIASPFPSNGSMGTDAGANQVSENHSAVMKDIQFHTLHFPVDLPISFYTKSWLGHDTTDSLTTTEVIYKNNSMPIHLPTLLSILFEQLLQPFFVFQLFCVTLWSLDEYWYYAVFTLFSLVIFETTMAFTRLKNLSRLRETLPPPFPVWVYRKRNWVIVMSDCLVPGDVMSLTSRDQIQSNGRHYFPAKLMAAPSRTTEEHHVDGGRYVPADVLLLHGNALVNEASLTGECEPQRKEAISCDDDVLDIEQEDFKRSIVFGGTILLSTDNQSSVEQNTRFSQPPDGGCVFFVLRTGFDSLQGALLRTIVHSTSKSRGDSLHNTSDTFVFILLLLLCALGSSLLVLLAGWNDPTRNKFKLLLHVIIILTSVVPPEVNPPVSQLLMIFLLLHF
jgi:cation-transporting ATPase 13A1